MYASAAKLHLSCRYDLDLWPRTLKTRSTMSTHMMDISAKIHWNRSTKYRDIATSGVRQVLLDNGRTNRHSSPTDAGEGIIILRRDWKRYASACCTHIPVVQGSEASRCWEVGSYDAQCLPYRATQQRYQMFPLYNCRGRRHDNSSTVECASRNSRASVAASYPGSNCSCGGGQAPSAGLGRAGPGSGTPPALLSERVGLD